MINTRREKKNFIMELQNESFGGNEVCFTLKSSNVTRQIVLRAVVLECQILSYPIVINELVCWLLKINFGELICVILLRSQALHEANQLPGIRAGVLWSKRSECV